ncbi:MAG: hypothetical protein Q4F29_07280 [Lachnospiraceae bacterium]|nr:hypothetical protein [Lachnospiraceae bacterium]
MNMDIGEGAKDVPIGFGLSLAMNEHAMERYSQMTEMERKNWLLQARQVKSKAEMEKLVNRM